MTNAELSAYLEKYLAENRQNIINDLKALADIPSVLGPAGAGAPFGSETRRCLDEAAGIMEGMGHTCVIPESGEYGYCEYGEGEKVIGLIPHLDVVPAEGEWSSDPFDARIKDGYIIGRGVSDDKGGAIGSMYALDAIAKAGIQLKNKVRLIFCCNEELDMEGDAEILRRDGMVPDFSLIPDAFFPIGIGEKGSLSVTMTAPVGSRDILGFESGAFNGTSVPPHAECLLKNVPGLEDELSELAKRDGRFTVVPEEAGIRVSAKGVAAHPVMPESGENAGWILMDALAGMSSLSESDRAMLRRLADEQEGYLGTGLGIEGEDELSGPLTCAALFSRFDGESYTVQFSVRYCISMRPEDLTDKLQKYADDKGYSLSAKEECSSYFISPEDPRIKCLQRSYFNALGQKPQLYVHPGNTYAGRLKNAVIFGNEFRAPGPFGATRGRAHQSDEVTNVDLLVQSVRAYVYAVLALDEML